MRAFMSLLLVLSLVGPVLAEGNGPHLMDVTQKLLRLTPRPIGTLSPAGIAGDCVRVTS